MDDSRRRFSSTQLRSHPIVGTADETSPDAHSKSLSAGAIRAAVAHFAAPPHCDCLLFGFASHLASNPIYIAAVTAILRRKNAIKKPLVNERLRISFLFLAKLKPLCYRPSLD